MKRIVSLALSLALILGLCMVPTVSAANATLFNDPVDSSWDKNGFYYPTGNFSSVPAAEVDSSWTGRDNVLKIWADNGVVSVYDAVGFGPNSYAKNNDKLYVQYDMYYPAYAGEGILNASFELYGAGNIYYGSWRSVGNGQMAFYWMGSNGDGGYNYWLIGNGESGIPADTWYTVTYIIDTMGTGYYGVNSELSADNQRTVRVIIKNEAGQTIVSTKPVILEDVKTDILSLKMNGGSAATGLIYLDNISVSKKDLFAMTTESIEAVPANAGVSVAFNQPVSAESLTNAKLLKDGEDITEEVGAVFSKDSADTTGKTVKLNWEILDGEETYTIDFAGVTDSYGSPIEVGAKTIDFATIAAPEFDITATFKKGLLGTSVVENLADAAGSMVSANVTITSAVPEDFTATAFAGLYDANGVLVSCGFAGKTFASGETLTFDVALEIPEVTTGMSMKVFVCDSLSNVGAYSAPVVLD